MRKERQLTRDFLIAKHPKNQDEMEVKNARGLYAHRVSKFSLKSFLTGIRYYTKGIAEN